MSGWRKGVAASAATFAITVTVLAASNGDAPSDPADVRSAAARRAIAADAEVERGNRALKRHDFRGGLLHGRVALRLAPESVRPLSVIADAQIELGRYEDAARTLQLLMDRKPHLAAYSRVSYYRELHGDVAGALEAMRLAASAGGSERDVAVVQTLVGNLELDRGRIDAAERTYRTVLTRSPGHAGALHGLARVDAARGDLDSAARRQQPLAADPKAAPEAVIALGEFQLAAGQTAAGDRTMQKAREVLRAEAIRGVANANERALVEADHGDSQAAIRLGRRGWEHAPSIVSADALGWADTRAGRPRTGLAWARRALRTGSRDRRLLHHAGIAARDAGKPELARRWLRRSVAGSPAFSPPR